MSAFCEVYTIVRRSAEMQDKKCKWFNIRTVGNGSNPQSWLTTRKSLSNPRDKRSHIQHKMSTRSASRGRSLSRTRSPTPDHDRNISRSPRRSITPRSRSASLTPRRRRSPSRSSRSYSRSLTRSRSPSPPRSSKVSHLLLLRIQRFADLTGCY